MKKYNKFGYVGAMMLAGLVGFSACSSDDDVTQEIVNPGYNGESVKTQFAIAIPQAGKSGRMTEDNTQGGASSPFLGMEGIWMIPFSEVVNGNLAISGPDMLELAPITTGGGATGLQETHNVRVYTDVNVPFRTSNFLFYGTAGNGGFVNGELDRTLLTKTLTNTNEILFKLQYCGLTTGEKKQGGGGSAFTFTEVQEAFTTALNGIVATLKADGWHTDANPQKNELYKRFTSLKAGSAPMVAAEIKMLVDEVTIMKDALVPGQDDAEIGKLQAILTALCGGGNALFTGPECGYNEWTEETYGYFPGIYQIPDGAAQLEFVGGAFSYLDISGVGAAPTVGNVAPFKIQNLRYPATLEYFANTDIAVNNTSTPALSSDWNALWTNNTWAAPWNNTSVGSTTQAIALKKKIQYGVARLESGFKCKNAKLEDNNKGHFVTVEAKGFPVGAILVGGQPSEVGWDFLPTASAKSTDVIYDKCNENVIFAVHPSKASSLTMNHTLVLDNTQSDKQEDVFVAVELRNNTKDVIYGADNGIIPAGALFYLVAKLDASKISGNFDGTNVKKAVFVQDHVTKATFTINNLKNAYVTIPDLRASKMALGMSVDLEWEAGIDFGDVNLGI